MDGLCADECIEERKTRSLRAMVKQGIRLPARVVQSGEVAVRLSRPQLRRLGRAKTVAEIKAAVPLLNRQQRRELARQQHKAAWNRRDHDLVRKFSQGFTPQPKPLAIDVTKTS
jgi:hypothetical protein